jgi:HK97 gp10 family phage protein
VSGANAVRIEIEGAREIAEKLRALPAKIEKRIMVKALRAGAQEIQAAAMGAAPVKTGALAAGIHIETSTRGGKVTVSVSTGDDQYYAIMLEKGTQNHFGMLGGRLTAQEAYRRKKKSLFSAGSTTERMKPHPFMGPAFDQSAEQAVTTAAEILKEEIEAEMASTQGE